MAVAMQEAIVSPDTSVALITSPLPAYGAADVLIKVHVAGSNPKDWKHPTWFNKSYNTGDDIAGTIAAVGAAVVYLQPGMRVAALHRLLAPGAAFAEYAVAPAHTVIPLPASTSFEEGATLPLASATAALALFVCLSVPSPWAGGRHSGFIKPSERVGLPRSPFPWLADKMPRDNLTPQDAEPLLVYGGATAVGAYAIQFARRAKTGPIIAVAGNGIEFVKSMIDEAAGDVVVDYRQPAAQIVADIRAALRGRKLRLCFDAVSAHGSHIHASELLQGTPGARIVTTNPEVEMAEIPASVEHKVVMVIDVFDIQSDFARSWAALVGGGLAEGWFRPHPHQIVPGGLAGVEGGLRMLREGKISAKKLVFRIAQT